MNRKRAERFTSPAIAVLAVVMVTVIALRPDSALLLLAGAELVAGAGCVLLVGVSLRRNPPAPPSAALFAGLSLFWLGMATLSLWWFTQGR